MSKICAFRLFLLAIESGRVLVFMKRGESCSIFFRLDQAVGFVIFGFHEELSPFPCLDAWFVSAASGGQASGCLTNFRWPVGLCMKGNACTRPEHCVAPRSTTRKVRRRGALCHLSAYPYLPVSFLACVPTLLACMVHCRSDRRLFPLHSVPGTVRACRVCKVWS